MGPEGRPHGLLRGLQAILVGEAVWRCDATATAGRPFILGGCRYWELSGVRGCQEGGRGEQGGWGLRCSARAYLRGYGLRPRTVPPQPPRPGGSAMQYCSVVTAVKKQLMNELSHPLYGGHKRVCRVGWPGVLSHTGVSNSHF